MMCEKKDQIQCAKRKERMADKATGFTRIINMFRHVSTESSEDSSNSQSPLALPYIKAKRYTDQMLRLEELQNRAIEDIRRRIF